MLALAVLSSVNKLFIACTSVHQNLGLAHFSASPDANTSETSFSSVPECYALALDLRERLHLNSKHFSSLAVSS